MTFFAEKSAVTGYPGRPNVDVHITYGPVTIVVNEDAGHLRSFHRELGKLLDELDKQKAAG